MRLSSKRITAWQPYWQRTNRITASQYKLIKEKASRMSDKELGFGVDQRRLRQPG